MNPGSHVPSPDVSRPPLRVQRSTFNVQCSTVSLHPPTAIHSKAASPKPHPGIHALLALLILTLAISQPTASELSPASPSFSFPTSILPVLTKAGCNSGACHGAATGQGGFRLSLLGYDPEEDYLRITRELHARRVDPLQPAHSLLLRKASNQTEHEGGRRIPRDSEAYRTLLAWIDSGASYGNPTLSIESLVVSPPQAILNNLEENFQIRVTSIASNGDRTDVTPLALYNSNNDGVAQVSKTGQVQAQGRGATSIMIRYAGQVGAVRVALPFAPAYTAPPSPAHDSPIDRHIELELARLGLPVSPQTSDTEFVRRIHLDLTGRLPDLEDTRAFLAAAPSESKRTREIERLLASDAFVDLWTLHLADVLLIGGRRTAETGTAAYHGWLRQRVAANTPVAHWFRELLTADGPIAQNGPANYYALASDPRDLSEHVARMFLGTQVACARCHAHPADRWTRKDYHQFAAFFARVKSENGLVRTTDRGEVEDPKTGVPLTPRPLGSSHDAAPNPTDRRQALADWLFDKPNPLFTRSFVNRVWKQLMGRGLVEPVDDLRPTNPATHPDLLDALADSFARDRYDLRQLIRSIVLTRTYQRSSIPQDTNRQDDRFYSRALPKPLSAQVFLDATAQITSVPHPFEGAPQGTRAVQLPGARTPSYALDILGRCSRDVDCDTTDAASGGIARALHLLNGSTINDKLQTGLAHRLASTPLSNREVLDELYLRAYARPPTSVETDHWLTRLGQSTERREFIEDLLWALLNSREFAVNH